MCFDKLQVFAFTVLRIPRHSDRDIGPTVKCVDRVDHPAGKRVDLGNGDGTQITFVAICQRVQHRQRQHIVHIATDVGVKDDR